MRLDQNTVLVTGGGSGIGLALAERFLRAGSNVIICGRRAHKLEEARAQLPTLHTRVCDLADPSARVTFVEWVTSEFLGLNVLVNNAGIQRRDFNVAHPQSEPWQRTHEELAINLEAPIHLAELFIPHLQRQSEPAIINVTSGLAFVPIAAMPLYCATKAALRSFTLSLRRQLAPAGIKVIEIIPPAVNTDLGGPGLHNFGVPLNDFADDVFSRLGQGELEIAYGFAQQSSRASRAELDQMFERMNQR
ncbi:MAG TPA: SDR family NAD(P)-dependent oxidoreductase [Candidatus Angelobacter sp.]|nr:SDR family NAD(P)-dependent oxidoreductase [Candidatus Angelobacter sp.]